MRQHLRSMREIKAVLDACIKQLTRIIQIQYNQGMTEMTSVGTDFISKEPIKKWVKVGKDENTGLWYYENSLGARSQAIFVSRKKAWAKGNDYIDFIYPKKKSNKRGRT